MSAVVIIQQSDAIHILTDGAIYDESGVLLRLASKTQVLPNSNCIFATRGGSYASRAMQAALSPFDSFDAIIDALPLLMAFNHALSGEGPHLRDFELSIAGWSESIGRWTAGVATTFEPQSPRDTSGASWLEHYEQYVPFYAAPLQAMPGLDWLDVIGGQLQSQEHLDSLDPAEIGLAMLERQRLFPMLGPGGSVSYCIGGRAEMSTVSAAGISRRVLREWPDVVGEKIVPAGAPSLDDVCAAHSEELLAFRQRLAA